MARNKGQITGLRNTLCNLSSLGQAWTFGASSDGMKMKKFLQGSGVASANRYDYLQSTYHG